MLEEYGRYGDAVVGRFGTTPKGGKAPSVRAVLKPLLALFHGDQGCKRWKQALDKQAKSAPCVSAGIKVCQLGLSLPVLNVGKRRCMLSGQLEVPDAAEPGRGAASLADQREQRELSEQAHKRQRVMVAC